MEVVGDLQHPFPIKFTPTSPCLPLKLIEKTIRIGNIIDQTKKSAAMRLSTKGGNFESFSYKRVNQVMVYP